MFVIARHSWAKLFVMQGQHENGVHGTTSTDASNGGATGNEPRSNPEDGAAHEPDAQRVKVELKKAKTLLDLLKQEEGHMNELLERQMTKFHLQAEACNALGALSDLKHQPSAHP